LRGIAHLVLSMEADADALRQFFRAGVPLRQVPGNDLLFDDLVAWAVGECWNFLPTHAVATLGSGSCEVLRHLPQGIPKFAMVQSDDPAVFSMLSLFAMDLTATVGVSRSICETHECPVLTTTTSTG